MQPLNSGSSHASSPTMYNTSTEEIYSLQEGNRSMSTIGNATPALKNSPSQTPLTASIPPAENTGPVYIRGWRLRTIIVTLLLAIYLVTLEVSIVSTSLVAIANDLKGLDKSSWIVTAYLTTFTGFLIVWAKLSDILGRKLILVISLCLFIAFSAACGSTQNTVQLIVCRAFQGLGGSGTYSLIVVIFFELVPPKNFASITSLISATFALALLTGPLFGGVINQFTTWRWVFLLNIPAGLISLILLLMTLPNQFPRHGRSSESSKLASLKLWQSVSKADLQRLDILGASFLLIASIFLVTALEEAGLQFQWNSPFIITSLCISFIAWVLFLWWSRKVTKADGVLESIFPWRLLQNRVRCGMILSIFLAGAPFTVAVIQIPLRFQAVNNLSPLGAGVRLLPYAVVNPIGSVLSPFLAGRYKVPPVYILLVGSILQIVGFTLLSFSPATETVDKAVYAYEAIAGFGLGGNLACLIALTPFVVEKRDKSVAISAMVQFRTLGGAIGLAIASNAFSAYVKSGLASAPLSFSSSEIARLIQSTRALDTLPLAQVVAARQVFAHGYNLQMQIMIAFCVAQIPAALLMWKRKNVVLGG